LRKCGINGLDRAASFMSRKPITFDKNGSGAGRACQVQEQSQSARARLMWGRLRSNPGMIHSHDAPGGEIFQLEKSR
jgi:hypothetical protein